MAAILDLANFYGFNTYKKMQSPFFLIIAMFQIGINKKMAFNKHFAQKYIRVYTYWLIRSIVKIIQSRPNRDLTILNSISQQARCYFSTSITKPEWWASSTFLWSFMKQEKYVLILPYLHKFKMAAHGFHLCGGCVYVNVYYCLTKYTQLYNHTLKISSILKLLTPVTP